MPQTLLYGKISDCFRPYIRLFSALSQYRIETFMYFFSQELYGIYPLQRNFCIRNTMCNDDTVMYFQSIQTRHLILSHFTFYHYLLVIINNNRWTRYKSFMDKNSKWRNQSDNSTLYKRKSRACKVYMEERRKWCSGIYRQESFAGKCHQGAGWGVHLWGHQCQTARKQCHRGSHRECFYHCRSQM